ncbi:hypothetical protein PYW08_012287 [Mythimna loreyi]|uniref:Uncharacterized protein n=1 Tax=Mythimna loreyi TaxID=667449 RepID=A0ACC2PZZ3_9NEOP|nr:hypothetical protein PYW08_012287 [Mythimna loreyi]
MDRRNKRNEETDKKIEHRIKDRGDLKKVDDKNLKKSEGITHINLNLPYAECGDSLPKELTRQKTNRNVCLKNPNKHEQKLKYLISGTNEKDLLNKNNYNNKDKLPKSYPELRQRIRERYTVKLNSQGNKSEHISLYKTKKEVGSKVAELKPDRDKRDPFTQPTSNIAERPIKQMSEECTQTIEKSIHSSAASAKTTTDSKRDKLSDKNPEKTTIKKKRKPIIRTITSKNGPMRVYKAVHFVDNHSTTPLEISIPGSIVKKQQKVSKYTETNSLKLKPKVTVSKVSSTTKQSKASVKEEKLTKLAAVRKRAEKRREKNFKRRRSPACSIKELPSPPTEVARWAPASVDPQTMPYYEAWINTTLATISKISKQDKLAYEKQAKLLKSFQKALEERPPTPELYYLKFTDERYTGRIKIRQPNKNQKKQQIIT